MANSALANLEEPKAGVDKEDIHSFVAMGKLPPDTITAIKNCTTLEFILNDNTDVSPQISISFEKIILSELKKNL